MLLKMASFLEYVATLLFSTTQGATTLICQTLHYSAMHLHYNKLLVKLLCATVIYVASVSGWWYSYRPFIVKVKKLFHYILAVYSIGHRAQTKRRWAIHSKHHKMLAVSWSFVIFERSCFETSGNVLVCVNIVNISKC